MDVCISISSSKDPNAAFRLQLLLYTCRQLRQMQEQLGGEDDAGTAAAAKGQQATLERLLRGKLHLVRQIHKLVTLEDSVFG
jgi:hypothetical protein